MSEIALLEQQLQLPGMFTPTGLNLPDDLSYNDWFEVGKFIARAHRAVAWWIGDWLLYGNDHGFLQLEIE